ncbi:hypothetical protein DITRI_Ditri01bG0024800 [Diplodiscus trichospermus]
MGACASLPKAKKAGAMAAPPPEPAKEDSLQAEQHATEDVIKVEEEENKTNDVDETKQQSVGPLLDELEKTEGKKEAYETQQPQVEVAVEPKKEEPESKKEEAKVVAEKEEPKVELKKEATKTEAPAVVEKVTEEQKENNTEAKET